MWTRSELKQNAKDQMKGRYWNYLGASLMPQIASYVVSIPLSIISQFVMIPSMLGVSMMSNSELVDKINEIGSFETMDFGLIMELYSTIMLAFVVPMIILTAISLAISIFILIPITVGMNRWYIRSREDRSISLSICFSVFKKSSYLKTVGAMAYQMLFSFLWTCLFYIPGIVKAYAYRMIPYIIADNPGIGAKRALKLSCQMTKGHKFDMFILDLSFIGWYILGFLACCIGIYAVVPYNLATYAELYDVLKKEAVEKSLCTMEELGYIMVVPETITTANV